MCSPESTEDRSRSAKVLFTDFMRKSKPGSLKYRAITAELKRHQAKQKAESAHQKSSELPNSDSRNTTATLFNRDANQRIRRNPIAIYHAHRFTSTIFPAYFLAAASDINLGREDATLRIRDRAITAAQTDLVQIESSAPRQARIIIRGGQGRW